MNTKNRIEGPMCRRPLVVHRWPYSSPPLLLLLLAATITQAQQFPNHEHLSQYEVSPHLVSITANGTVGGAGQAGSQIPLAPEPLQVASNFYSSTAASPKLRVNVSNVCERNQMRATVRLSRPFYGLIHTKDRRRRPACSLEGNGEQSFTLEISYTLNPLAPNHCGVVSHQLAPAPHLQTGNQSTAGQQLQRQPQLTLSVVLVVRLHKSIEFSDDRYFLLSCANRCSKPDCSTGNPLLESETSAGPGLQVAAKPAQARSPFVASESVVSPMLRQQAGPAALNKSLDLQQAALWPTEKCDTMLDLKFQWLVKLCWILSILLGAMFFAAIYLCLRGSGDSAAAGAAKQLKREKRSLVGKKGAGSSSASSSASSSDTNAAKSVSHSSKHVIYSPPRADLGPWANGTAAPSSADEAAAAAAASGMVMNEGDLPSYHHQFLMNQMRENENNLYLAAVAAKQQQQRQMILANLSLMATNAPDSQRPVLGRSAEQFNQQQHEAAARVKRRRSIGGSSAAMGLHENSYLAADNRAKLSSSQRAKSRSQTTIHYNQSQDPFKTVPFSYVNTGDQSDGSDRVYLGSDFVGMDVYGMPPAPRGLDPSRLQTFTSGHSGPDSMQPHSLPPDAHLLPVRGNSPSGANGALNTMARQEMMRKQGWANFKPTFVAPPQVDTGAMMQNPGAQKLISQTQQQRQEEQQLSQQQQQQSASQFDPQNSQQLINLIQHKHRQQIEQANRTAATMQSAAMFAEMKRQPAAQQRSSNVTQSRPPWR